MQRSEWRGFWISAIAEAPDCVAAAGCSKRGPSVGRLPPRAEKPVILGAAYFAMPGFCWPAALAPAHPSRHLAPHRTIISGLRLNRLAFRRHFWLPDRILFLRVMHVQLPRGLSERHALRVMNNAALSSSFRSIRRLRSSGWQWLVIAIRLPEHLRQPRDVESDPSRLG
jgi:hypothetical protein